MSVTVTRFTASWCMPCKAVAPILSELQGKYPDVKFIIVDVDEKPNLAMQKNVASVPTVLVEKDGMIVSSFVGVKSSQDYEAAIKSALYM